MATASGSQASGNGLSGTAKLWLYILVPLISLLVAILVAIGWYLIGGWPGDHAKYATVPVPGESTVTLPEGEIRLYWQAEAIGSGDTESVAGRPDELETEVTAAGGAEVPTSSVPSWLFTSINNDTGHEPYLRMTVPEAGEYTVATVMTAGGQPPMLAAVTVGAAPWNPGGSRLGGAIIIGLVIFLIGLLPLVIISLVNKRRGKSTPPTTLTAGADAPDETDKRYDWSG